ncbi:hypothetical protein XPR_3467 [Xanthomonas arboricola pv. pruni MAFF 301420]|uniref:Uncharacterized protein n=1 Tax=Xanthomonas arboricola pv. pruni MAFF 301420 TaxID=1418095 RepID=W4SKB0_9XANT|nr:hypothetical protein XPR_3467 [Xanthomonas arboricola pv. pruni MAFF 301420]GAE59806.1 hypothetical protein XPN_1712 [Xanthomonas arboricola pv. pruni MAFF 301427]
MPSAHRASGAVVATAARSKVPSRQWPPLRSPHPAAPRKPTQVVAKPVRSAAKPSGSPSLLSRIGRRLRSLVSGN